MQLLTRGRQAELTQALENRRSHQQLRMSRCLPHPPPLHGPSTPTLHLGLVLLAVAVAVAVVQVLALV